MVTSSFTIVSSFNIKDWELYAKTFVTSFIKKWDKDINLSMYYHDGELPSDAPTAPNVKYISLDTDEALLNFKETFKDRNGIEKSGTYNYRYDALKFCHKVFAITNEAFSLLSEDSVIKSTGHLIWLDADSETTKFVSLNQLQKMTAVRGTQIIHLGRKAIDYSETSFISFNLNSAKTTEFLTDFRGLYLSGELFGYREWHDGFVFSRLLNLHEQHGLVVKNLTPDCEDLAAFAISPLAEFIKHKKGNLKLDKKEETFLPVGPQRYAILPEIIKYYNCTNLLEVGTWNGARAIEMAMGALEISDTVHYTGFDLFDTATEETDQEEFNSKKHTAKQKVEESLAHFAREVAKDNKTFTFCLFEGDSKETLQIVKNRDYCNTHNIKPDFAYIDGGHSVRTCMSDYDNLNQVPVIVFDDFFTTDDEGKAPSEDKCGTNYVYNYFLQPSVRKSIIATKDRVVGGGFINFALVLSDPDLPEPPTFKPNNRIPIKVTPHDCMPSDYIIDNIKENKETLTRWIKERAKLHNEHMIIASGGPSLKENISKIKQIRKEKKAKVMCVKHALPILLEHNIIPWGCILLDPRPIEGESTHGIKRKTLFKKIPKRTKFFIASMTDTSVVKYITQRTDNVYGWDAFSQAIKEWEGLRDTMLITGGTCAATRSIGVAHVLGFRTFHLFGFDSSVSEPTEEQKN